MIIFKLPETHDQDNMTQ